MRVLWVSNAPWTATGYGNQTKLFTPRIKALGHDVAILAYWGLQGGTIVGEAGIPILPPGYMPYGQDVISPHAAAFQADIAISLMDAWVIEPEMIQGVRWCPWFPVDSEPLPGKLANAVRRAHRRIVYSRFGERMVRDAGMDCYYVPHGVDTKAFAPFDRKLARGITGLPQDAFVVGMVAANKGAPSRKAFYQHLAAFKLLKSRHPDALMYIHTESGVHAAGQALNLVEYMEFIGLRPKVDVLLPPQYEYVFGAFNDQHMNALYNSFDVHVLASMGEGFGLPTLEAQAAGCPVIVGDWTASTELCFAGWKVSKSETERWFWPGFTAYQYLVHPEALAEQMEAAYLARDDAVLREQARSGALAYDADLVTEQYWRPVLVDIEASLETSDFDRLAGLRQ